MQHQPMKPIAAKTANAVFVSFSLMPDYSLFQKQATVAWQADEYLKVEDGVEDAVSPPKPESMQASSRQNRICEAPSLPRISL